MSKQQDKSESHGTLGGAGATVFICISCRGPEANEDRPGQLLFDAVTARLREHPEHGITIAPVECLAVCKRPCTVALTGTDKWTCVVGDLHPDTNAGDVIAAALSYQASQTGIVPWRERPQSFRKGVVSRTPPAGFRLEASRP